LFLLPLKLFNGRQQILRFFDGIDRMERHDTRFDAHFVVVGILFDFALENPLGVLDFGKDGIVRILIVQTRPATVGPLKAFVGRHSTKQCFGLFVKEGNPGGRSGVFDDSGKNPTSNRIGVRVVAFFTIPVPVGGWVHLNRFLHGLSALAHAVYHAPPSLPFFKKVNVPLKDNQSALS
jgi:hypothetical protein